MKMKMMKMKKITFLSIGILLSVLVISLSSCQKDVKNDISQLKTEMAAAQASIDALNQAISAGKLITEVTPVTDGYKITFSDNTSITIKNGTAGATGFTPIIGVDAEGYWTVITSDGGTPARILDAEGNPIKAVADVPYIGENGNWFVGTTDTGVKAQGPAGATGATGADGVNGKSPKIDTTTGEWMVWDGTAWVSTGVKAQGPAGPQGPAGQDVNVAKALNVQNGILYVDTTATNVKIPGIAYNTLTRTLLISINDNGNYVTYEVPLADDVIKTSDIVSVVAPAYITSTIIRYGSVPSAADFAQIATPQSKADSALAWAGVTYDSLLRSSGMLPVIINPANASVANYTFEVVKQGQDSTADLYSIQPVSIKKGFTGSFTSSFTGSTKDAPASNGLYSLIFHPTSQQAATAASAAFYPQGFTPPSGQGSAGESYELAVRATVNNGTRTILSGYQYAIKVQMDVNTVAAPNSSYADTVYLPIGTSKDLLSYYDRTDVTPNRTLVASDFFKSEAIIPAAYAPYITTGHTATVATVNNPATVSHLSDMVIPLDIKTMDWRGKFMEHTVNATFYAALNTPIDPITFETDTLRNSSPSDLNQKTASLAPMFATLDAAGKKALWRAQATDVEVELNDSGNPIPGVSYEFLDSLGNVLPTPLVTATDVNAVRSIRFTYDETTAMPGTYAGKLVFKDRRSTLIPGIDSSLFTVSLPFTIVNPDMSALISTMTDKVPAFWTGQSLVVYGTSPSAPIQGTYPQSYDLYKAYLHLDATSTVTAPDVSVNDWGFGYAPTTPPSPLTTSLTSKTNEVFGIDSTTIYVPYNVDLYYYYFGNALNKQKVETITVLAKSEVKEGQVEQVPDSTLQVVNGDITTAPKAVSGYYKAVDYLGVNLDVFGTTRDVRVASVTLTNTSPNAILVNLVQSGNDWTVQATNAVAQLATPYVDVPLQLTITDLYGQKLVSTLYVRVLRP